MILTFDKVLETIHRYMDPPWIEEPQWVFENIGNKRGKVKQRIPKQVGNRSKVKNCVYSLLTACSSQM